MLCKCHWTVLYTVHFTAFRLGGPFFPGHGVYAIARPCVRPSVRHTGVSYKNGWR